MNLLLICLPQSLKFFIYLPNRHSRSFSIASPYNTQLMCFKPDLQWYLLGRKVSSVFLPFSIQPLIFLPKWAISTREMNTDQHWQNLSPHSMQSAGATFVLLSLSRKPWVESFLPSLLPLHFSEQMQKPALNWTARRWSNVLVYRVSAWKAAVQGIAVQQR